MALRPPVGELGGRLYRCDDPQLGLALRPPPGLAGRGAVRQWGEDSEVDEEEPGLHDLHPSDDDGSDDDALGELLGELTTPRCA